MSLFLAGGLGYPLLEILWRGRTHWSMAIAGGMSASLIGRIKQLRMSRMKRAFLCGAGITAIEYLCGRLWNRRYNVWDYRRTPLNWQGQVCLPYSLMWCALSYGMLSVLDALDRKTGPCRP